jgi:hypothetical protein
MNDMANAQQMKAIAKEYYDATLDGDLSVARKIFNIMVDEGTAEEFRAWRRYCYEYYRGYRGWVRDGR